LAVIQRVRRSLALKLILASAIPSAMVLLAGESALLVHSKKLLSHNPALAFQELSSGVVMGTLLALTFAGMAIALTARHFLVKPIRSLQQTMARAELGEFLIRSKVNTEDELGQLSKSFNTMLSRVTDMAVADIETQRTLDKAKRELALQEELKAVNEQLEAHVGEMELLLEVGKAVSGTIELTEQLEALGKQVCARFDVSEFSLMLIDEQSRELVIEAIAGRTHPSVRGQRFTLDQGVAGEAATTGKLIYVPDVTLEPRFFRLPNQPPPMGSLVSVPLRAQGKVLGVMNLIRSRVDGFLPQEVRLSEAIGAQAALSIANAKLYRQTLELSFTDPLTGVANRRQLFWRLEQELSRTARFGEPVSLLLLDLDFFKQINDRHGHSVGDRALRAVAQVLEHNVRKVDLVTRFGGDEFCVLLPRTGKPEALEVAEKLRRAVAATELPCPESDKKQAVTISVGVATSCQEVTDAANLMNRADAALFDAKRTGRDRVSPGAPALVSA
jgi:diguanylate cyclase (GGDEF)-like protein